MQIVLKYRQPENPHNMRWVMPSHNYDYLDDCMGDNKTRLERWVRENEEIVLEHLSPEFETISLAYVLKQWVEQGNGVEICGGDYTMLLRIALENACTMDEWTPIYGMRLVLEPGWLREILSPDWWAYQVFQYHKRQREQH
jgi:hypothetical protein